MTDQAIREVYGYQVVDAVTGVVVRSYGPAQRKAATRLADKRSLAYGSYRYTVRILWCGVAPAVQS